jgi:hypothetical protein
MPSRPPGQLGSNDRQEPPDLRWVDRAGRVTAALPEGGTNHLEGRITPQRPPPRLPSWSSGAPPRQSATPTRLRPCARHIESSTTRSRFPGCRALHRQARPRRDLEVGLQRRRRRGRGRHLPGNHPQIDPAGRSRPLPRHGLGQRGNLGVAQGIVDHAQQIDVAATGDVVVDGQRAVQDHPGSLPERPRAGARKRPRELRRLLGSCIREESMQVDSSEESM